MATFYIKSGTSKRMYIALTDRDEGNKCFRIVSIPSEASGFRWEQAVLLCRAGPGFRPDIASIHSEEEMGEAHLLLISLNIVL